MAFTWQEVTVPTSGGQDLRDFMYDSGHGVLCAIGGGGLVYTTPDALTWTKQTAAENNGWRGLAYAPTLGTLGRLVAVASSGTNRVMYSDDGGATWTAASASAANSWQSVVWAAALSLFVAVASTGAADGSTSVMTSPDGITWTTRAGVNPRQAWSGVTWSSTLGLLVAASASTASVGGVVMTSTNGTAWTVRTTPANQYGSGGAASGTNFVTWDSVSGLFAFCSLNNVGSADRFVTTSPDGVNWTKQTLPNPSDASGGLIGFPVVGLVLIRQNSGNDNINTSLNGSTWATENTGFNRFFDCAGKIESRSTIVFWAQGSNTIMLVGSPVTSTVTGVSTSDGPLAGGTPVTITGTNFSGTPTVTFGGTPATSVIVVNSTTITCVTPAHALGLVAVAVGSATLANAFTYRAAPTITSVSPSSGTFCGGLAVTIAGTGFYGAPTVTLDGVAATSVVVVSATSITCVSPVGIGGIVDVVVTNPDGQVATAVDAFTYTCGCRNAQSATTLIYSALRLCNEGLLRAGRGASSEQLADGFARLNDMLNAWAIERLTMFRVLRTTKVLAANTASYTIGTGGDIDIVRPEAIESAGLILDNNAVPVYEKEIDVLTDQRWQLTQQKDLQNPLAQGVYFDHGWSAGLARVYPWPVPSVGTTTLVLYTLEALTAFTDLTTCYTFPPGFGEAIRYQLALRLAREFGGLRDPNLTTSLAVTAFARVKRANSRLEESALDPRTPGLVIGGVAIDRTGGLRG